MPRDTVAAIPVPQSKPRGRICELAGTVVRGWIFDRDDPDRRFSLRVVLERRGEAPETLATIVADRYQEVDLGDDRRTMSCGFEYRVPAQSDVARLRLFELTTDTELEGSPLHLGVAPRLEGFLDGVDEDGMVFGWAWGSSAEYRCDLDVLVDGLYAGTAFAVQPRGDLAEASIGSGRHGFFWPPPDDLLDGREHEIGVVYHATNRHLVQSPARLRLSRLRYDGHASLGRDGILRGSFTAKAQSEESVDRLSLELLLAGEVLCSLTARIEPPRRLPEGRTLRAYSFAVPIGAVDGPLELSIPRMDCQEFRAEVGHDGSKGAHPCRDAKSLVSLTLSSTSCWPAPIPRQPSIRTV